MNRGFRSIAGRVTLVLAIVLAPLGTAACGASTSPRERVEVLGTWETEYKDHVAQIELHGDGTISVRNLPRSAIAGTTIQSLDWGDTVNATGRWHFTEPLPESYSQASIWANLKGVDGSDESLQLRPWAGGELLLYFGDVEVGEHLTFNLVEKSSTPSPETVARAELVGQWSSDDDGQLWLKEDGTFELTDMPLGEVAVDASEVTEEVWVDLHGFWSFTEQPLPLDPSAGVTLHVRDVDGLRPQVFDVIGPALQETEGGFTLELSDGRLRWELLRNSPRNPTGAEITQ